MPTQSPAFPNRHTRAFTNCFPGSAKRKPASSQTRSASPASTAAPCFQTQSATHHSCSASRSIAPTRTSRFCCVPSASRSTATSCRPKQNSSSSATKALKPRACAASSPNAACSTESSSSAASPTRCLSALYAQCVLVVAPSLLEGFGLPVAEALAAGCRVACSDIPAFRATATPSCVLFNPTDVTGESLVAALRNALQPSSRRRILAAWISTATCRRNVPRPVLEARSAPPDQHLPAVSRRPFRTR